MKKLLLYTIIHCLCTHFLFALEGIKFESITTKNGLSQNTVRCMMQDSHGFIWLGTMNGLNRFDGYEFIVMQPQFGEVPSLSDNRIKSVIEDKNGFIWIRTYGNTVSCYDPRVEKFIDYNPSNGEGQKTYTEILGLRNNDIWLFGKNGGCARVRFSNNAFNTITFDKKDLGTQRVNFVYESIDGTVWIGTEKGLNYLSKDELLIHIPQMEGLSLHSALQIGKHIYFFTNNNQIIVLDPKTKRQVQHINLHSSPEDILLNSTFQLNDNTILIGSKQHTYVLDINQNKISRADELFGGKDLQNAFLTTDNKGNPWIYNRTGNIWQYKKEKQLFKEINLIPSSIISLIDYERFNIFEDSDNTVWITTYGNGLFALDMDTDELLHFKYDENSANGLYSNYLLCIMEDKSGEIWVGSEYAGISKISRTSYKNKIFYPEEKKTTSQSNSIRSIYRDKESNIWLGTRKGTLYVFDRNFNKIKSIDTPKGTPYAIAEDTIGNKWIGSKNGGLLIIPPNGQPPYPNYTVENTPSLTGNNIYTILKDSKGRMWIGTFGGGLLLAEQFNGKLKFSQFLDSNRNQKMVRCSIQDKDGWIWVGSDDGVAVFKPDELIKNREKFTQFIFNKKDDTSLNNNEVKVIFEDSKGRIWLGTGGGGLNLVIKENANTWFKHYSSQKGLTNDIIQAILEDNEGNLWISTESGMSKFNPESEKFENLSFSNIWQGDFFSETTCLKGLDGELMFGSYYGLYIFNPSGLHNKSYSPPVTITRLKINGKDALPAEKDGPLSKSINMTHELYLKHNQNSFSLEFAALNFHNSFSNRYTYILDGYENSWSPTSRLNMAAYRNLPPGEYTFRVKGCNSSGVWNETETILHITVSPPWWRTTPALIFYIVLVIGAIYLTIVLINRMNKLNNAVEVEKRLTEYKLRFFTNISHEFRTPLTIIQGSIEKLVSMEDLPEKGAKQIHILSKSSKRLLRLIEQLLEFRRLQNNKMQLKLEETEIVSFLHDIFLTFSETAEKMKVDFIFESNYPNWKMPLDKNKVDKIVYNLLSNAFKAISENGAIKMDVEINPSDDALIINITDNGCGIPKEKQPYLFIRFQQFGSTSHGTGIGLHLSSELATVHKGNIVYSNSDSGGSCFSVMLPLSESIYEKEDFDFVKGAIEPSEKLLFEDPVSVNKSKMVKSEKDAGSLKQYNVLVIEDDDDIREFLSDHLSEYFTVSTAQNGVIGLEKATNEYPDLIICDVMMPEMDGFEVTRRLKSELQTSHIPIIILTAHSSEEHQIEGLEAGTDAYITKPFSVKLLIVRAIKLIEQRKRLQDKFTQEPGLASLSIYTTEQDKTFIDKVHKIIEENLSNPTFSIGEFAQSVNMGRTAFYKKIKGITGYSPNIYLRIMRMKKAAELLTTTNMNVSEIAFEVGIEDSFYFSRCFKTQFGKSPSQYSKEAKKKQTDTQK